MKFNCRKVKPVKSSKLLYRPALMAAAIALWAAAPALAKEAPELAFHPTQAWTVRAVEGVEIGSGGPACTLANEFNNGFVIQVTGTQAGPNNMNIDFRQPVFETGSPHEVRLSVPAQESRVYAGQAAGEGLLVVGMENSRNLFEAMRSSGVLDMSVEGNEFRFYLTGIADATLRFDDCVRGKEAKVATTLPEGVKQLPLENLEEEKIEPVPVQEILPPLPEPVFKEEAQHEEARQKAFISEQTETERVSLSRPEPPKHKRLSEQLAEQLSQEPALQEPQAKPAETDLTGLAPEPALAQEQPETAIEEPESIDWNAPRPKPAPQRISARTPEPKVMRKEASGEVDLTGVYMPGETPEDSPERIEPASSDSSISGRNDLADLNRKISELEGMVRELRDENAMLDEELKLALEAAQEERVAISSDNWNLERATMRYNEAERQIKRLGQQLQRERAECQVEKKELESMLFDPALTDQQQIARLADLEGKLQKTEEDLELQRRRYEEQIRILEERLSGQ